MQGETAHCVLLLYVQLKLDASRDCRRHSKLMNQLVMSLVHSVNLNIRVSLRRPEAFEIVRSMLSVYYLIVGVYLGSRPELARKDSQTYCIGQ